MSSRSIQIIGGEDRQHAWVDAATNALLVKVVNPSGGGGGGGDVNLVQYGGVLVGAANAIHVQPGTGAAFPVTDNGGSLTVDGTVAVSGTVAVTQSGAWSVAVNNFPATQPVSGTVTAAQATHDNLNANANLQVGDTDVGNANPVPVSDAGGSLTVDGTVAVSGTVAVTQSGAWTVGVNNFPAVQPVNDNGGSLTVDGTVAVSAVGGTVAVTQSGAWLVDVGTISNLVDVTGSTVNIGNVTPGTGPSELGKAHDQAWLAGDVGVAAMAVQDEAGATTPSAPGDYRPLTTDNAGQLRCAVASTTIAGTVTISGVITGITPGFTALSLGKLEDNAHASGDLGVMALAVRNDNNTSLAGTNGDYTPISVDSTGRVNCASYVVGGSTGNPMDVFQTGELSPSGGGAAPFGPVPMFECTSAATFTNQTYSHGFLDRTSGGIFVQVVGSATLPISGSITSLVPGTTATALGKAEDAVHTTGDVGVAMLAVRNDAGANLVSAAGDYANLQVDANGRLHVTITGIIPGTAATQMCKAEDAPAANGDPGFPVLAVRRDALVASVSTNADYCTLAVDAVGALWTRDAGVTTIALSGSTRGRPIQITGTATAGAVTLHTATTTAGQLDRVFIWLTNTSAASVTVTIEFGTTGAANELKIIVPANETVLAVDGAVLGGAATDVIEAYASTASVVNAFGRVERLTA